MTESPPSAVRLASGTMNRGERAEATTPMDVVPPPGGTVAAVPDAAEAPPPVVVPPFFSEGPHP